MSTDLAVREFNAGEIDLIKRTICAKADNDELALFLRQCQRTGLDPFAKQIYAVKRWNSEQKREVMTSQVSIDGFRLIADRSGKYEGQIDQQWCAPDGKWVDVWVGKEPPHAARAGVYKHGFREALTAVALWEEYAQRKKDGGLTFMWSTKPALMLAKCAESLALRKAFPQELSGLYTSEEMGEVIDAEPVKHKQEPKPAGHPDNETNERNAKLMDEWVAKIDELATAQDYVRLDIFRRLSNECDGIEIGMAAKGYATKRLQNAAKHFGFEKDGKGTWQQKQTVPA